MKTRLVPVDFLLFTKYHRGVTKYALASRLMLLSASFFLITSLPLRMSYTAHAQEEADEINRNFHLAAITSYDPTFYGQGGQVSIIDTRNNSQLANFTLDQKPQYAAMSKDGNFAYIIGGGYPAVSEPRVWKIDLNTLSIVQTLTLPQTGSSPSFTNDFEISPNGQWLVVVNIHKATLYLVDTATMTLAGSVILCPEDCGTIDGLWDQTRVIFSKSGSSVYVVDRVEGLLKEVSVPSLAILRTLPAFRHLDGYELADMKPSLDRRNLYVSAYGFSSYGTVGTIRKYTLNTGNYQDYPTPDPYEPVADMEIFKDAGANNFLATGSLNYYSGQPGKVYMLNLDSGMWSSPEASSSNKYFTYVKAGNELWSVCYTAVSLCDPTRASVIDMATLTTEAYIHLPSNLTREAFASLTPNGRYYFVPTDTSVVVIDTLTKGVVTQIPFSNPPHGVYMQGDYKEKERYF